MDEPTCGRKLVGTVRRRPRLTPGPHHQPQVAIVAVAAHLSQHPLGERFGLPTLARRYRQDVDALEQVGAGVLVSGAVCLVLYRSSSRENLNN